VREIGLANFACTVKSVERGANISENRTESIGLVCGGLDVTLLLLGMGNGNGNWNWDMGMLCSLCSYWKVNVR